MIKEVAINGYQSHVNSTFHLSPGLTVITGQTDSGKTAIIRAIRWVVFGEPAGESFVNETVGEAIVQITLASGTIVTKGRRKGKTTYCVTTLDGHIQIFEQADVPQEVITALGIIKTSFGDFETALNFAYQLDAPFLISEPASAGAKVLGKIAGTEVVDLAVKAVSKDTYAARQERLQAEKDVAKIEAELQQYAELDAIKEQVETCELLLTRHDEYQVRSLKLQMLEGDNDGLLLYIARLEDDIYRLEVVPELQAKMQDIEVMQKGLDIITALSDRDRRLEFTITGCSDELSLYVNLETAAEDITMLNQAMNRTDILRTLEDKNVLLSDKLTQIDSILEATKSMDVAASDLQDLVAGISRLDTLKQLGMRDKNMIAYINERQKILEFTQNVGQVPELLISITDSRESLQRLIDLQTIFRIKDDTYRQAAARVPAAEKAMHDQQNLINEIWAELKVCPLCEQPIVWGDHGC